MSKVVTNQYEIFQKQLEEAAANAVAKKDTSELQSTLLKNQSLISEIVKLHGSGSSYLLGPYQTLYSSHEYELSGFYQDTLEQINPVALLGEDQ